MARAFAAGRNDLTQRVLRIVRRKRTCDLEDLIEQCTSYTWTEVFMEVDRMSRSGEVCLVCKKAGEYALTLPRAA
jgi:hypothetical protein